MSRRAHRLLVVHAAALLCLAAAGCGTPPAPPAGLPLATSAAHRQPPATLVRQETATPAASATAPPPVETAARGGSIELGPGFVNNFGHNLVRTADDRLYILAPDDNPSRSGGAPGYLRMLRATTPGSASAFEEMDSSSRPVSQGPDSAISDAAIAIDGRGLIHVIYQDQDGTGDGAAQVIYTTFATTTNSWGAREIVAAESTRYERGYGGAVISLDSSGTPHIAYARDRQIYYRQRGGGHWSEELQISSTVNESHHPAIAHGPDNTLHLAWHVRDPGNEILYRARTAGGRLSDVERIARYTRDTLNDVDQGPALTLTEDGILWCLYLDGNEYVRVSKLIGGTWIDDSPPQRLFAHAPTIAATGRVVWALLGHDENIDYAETHRLAGGTWTDRTVLEEGTFDGSANARWSQFFNGPSSTLDTLFFNEDSGGGAMQARLYYRALDVEPDASEKVYQPLIER